MLLNVTRAFEDCPCRPKARVAMFYINNNNNQKALDIFVTFVAAFNDSL